MDLGWERACEAGRDVKCGGMAYGVLWDLGACVRVGVATLKAYRMLERVFVD